jgi:hypothetical protein
MTFKYQSYLEVGIIASWNQWKDSHFMGLFSAASDESDNY